MWERKDAMAKKVKMAQNHVEKIRHFGRVPYDTDGIALWRDPILYSLDPIVLCNDLEIQNEVNNEPPDIPSI